MSQELLDLQKFVHQLIADHVNVWWELQCEKGNAWKPYQFYHKKDDLMDEANHLLKAVESQMGNKVKE